MAIVEGLGAMGRASIKEAILQHLDDLSGEAQQRVLDLVEALAAQTAGVPGRDLLAFSGALDPQDAQRMEEAIEEGCERVDLDAW